MMTFKMRRAMGVTLAALTVTAGISAVAFAGEPDTAGKAPAAEVAMKALVAEVRANEDGSHEYSIDGGQSWEKLTLNMTPLEPANQEDADFTTMEMKELAPADVLEMKKLTPAEAMDMQDLYKLKTDEETGKSYFSTDGGETWEPIELGGDGSFNLDSNAEFIPAAETVPAAMSIPAAELEPAQAK